MYRNEMELDGHVVGTGPQEDSMLMLTKRMIGNNPYFTEEEVLSEEYIKSEGSMSIEEDGFNFLQEEISIEEYKEEQGDSVEEEDLADEERDDLLLDGQEDSMIFNEQAMDLNEDENSGGDEEETNSQESDEEPLRERWTNIPRNWQSKWLVEYTKVPGPSSQLPDITSPREYLQLFLDNEAISLLVEETNKYAAEFFERNPAKENAPYYKH